jgi:hypothetical protein
MKSAYASLVAVLFATGALAQDKTAAAMAKLNVVLPRTAEEQLALSAAPEHLRADASVYVYGKRGYERVRAGTNGFVCLVNRDAFFYADDHFKPTCWDSQGETTFVPVMLKVGELLAAGDSADSIRRAIDAGFASSTFRAPDSGGIAYMLAGDVTLDPATAKITSAQSGHYMFYANKVTNTQLGYTRDARRLDASLPFIFAAGAGGSHGLAYIIAIPGQAHTHSATE